MANPLPFLLFLILAALGWPLFSPLESARGMLLYAGWVFLGGLIASGIRIAAQWEKALVFRLGKFRAIKGRVHLPSCRFSIRCVSSTRAS